MGVYGALFWVGRGQCGVSGALFWVGGGEWGIILGGWGWVAMSEGEWEWVYYLIMSIIVPS